MPAKASKPRSRSARSKSVEKKTPRSRSASRSRSRVKPKKVSSETKRPRSPSRESHEASPIKSSRSITSSTKTVTSRTINKTNSKLESDVRSTANSTTKSLNCNIFPMLKQNPIISCICSIGGMFIAPLIVFYIICRILNKSSNWGPSTVIAHANIPTEFSRYLDLKIHLFVWASLIEVSIVSRYFRLGKKISQVLGGRRFEHCNNFWLVMPLFFLPVVGELIKNGIKSAQYLIKNIPSLYFALIIMIWLSSFVAYYHSKSKMSRGLKTTGSAILDFYNGREPRPIIFGFDEKVVSCRYGICLYSLVVFVFAIAQYEKIGQLAPGMALYAIGITILMLDFIIFEHKALASYGVQNMGCGFNFYSLVFLMHPLQFTIYSMVYYTRPDLGRGSGTSCNSLLMGAASALFLLGYYIQRAADNQKYAFKTDPHHPRFANMESIPSSTGKRILAGGWWNLCRHPNYLGGILINIAFAIPSGFAYPYLWLYVAFVIFFTINHMNAVEKSMETKYGVAYTKYKDMVPKQLVPKVL